MIIIFVTPFLPSPVGHGGQHRTYQILNDLEKIAGSKNVHFLADHDIYERQPSRLKKAETHESGLNKFSISYWKKIFYSSRKGSFLTSFLKSAFRLKSAHDRKIVDEYLKIINNLSDKENSRQIICLIEHPRYHYLVDLSTPYSIPVVFCPQNIESLETQYFASSSSFRLLASLDFNREIALWEKVKKRLFISKSEVSLVGGLGFNSTYYPYIPVGDIRARLLELRSKRKHTQHNPGLFLAIGTGKHRTTRNSLLWLLEQIASYGLPEGFQIVIVGADTDKLLPPGQTLPGVKLMGWVEQSYLDQLTETANGVLVCQNSGFGAVTRITEFACSEIPVIASQHASYTMNLPPNVFAVGSDWNEWVDVMKRVKSGTGLESCRYDEWEYNQAFSLKKELESSLKSFEC